MTSHLRMKEEYALSCQARLNTCMNQGHSGDYSIGIRDIRKCIS